MKRTLSALVACSQTEPTKDASTEPAATSSAVVPAEKTASAASPDQINNVINDGGGAVVAPDEFAIVEETIGKLISVLPPEVRVKGDPNGIDKYISVDLPKDLQGEELKQVMDQIHPIAYHAFQDHQITTQVGRRDDGVLITVDAWSFGVGSISLYEQYELAKTNHPVIKNHFDYAHLNDMYFVLNDLNRYDRKGCVDALHNLHDTFKDGDLNLGGHELFYKIPDCGGISVNIHGYVNYMRPKLEQITDILEAEGTVPEGTRLVAQYPDNLEVVVPAPAEFAIKDRVQPFWNLGEVAIRQY